ncbi:MAG: colicin V production CvpA [Porticoccaceae bacterium]|nr:colicin V production CvpA [Porticoccaceae bacterium]
MNWADWTILAILGLSVLIGLIRGLVREALSLLVWVLAFFAATLFYAQGATWFDGLMETPSLRYISAWLVIFVGVLIVGSLVNYVIGYLVETTGLSGTDRLLGMVFGALRGIVVVMALVILVPGVLPVSEDQWWQDSKLIPYFMRFEDWAVDIAQGLLDWIQSFFSR